jgi:CBS domain-containing protein
MATILTAYGGRGLGYAMIGLGTLATITGYLAGIWAALVGIFLVGAAAAEKHQVEVAEALGEKTVGELMSAPAATLPAELSLSHARAVVRGGEAIPVVDHEGRAIGLLTAARAATARPGTIGEAALRDPELLVTSKTAAVALLERPALQRVGRAVVVDDARRPIGVISVADLERRSHSQRPRTGARSRPAGL